MVFTIMRVNLMVMGIMTLLAMSAFSYAIWKWQKGNRILYSFIYGQLYFWSTYILSCAVLIWLDVFQIWYAIACTLCISLIAILICYITHIRKEGYIKRENSRIWDKRDILAVLLCVVIAVLIHDKNELMGMSQDEGVYQTAAIS